MAFELIKKNVTKIPYTDNIVILKSCIRFPQKLRKKKNGFYKCVDIYKDGNKLGFKFNDDSLTGYVVTTNRLAVNNLKIKEMLKLGVYDYKKEKDMYIIDTGKPIKTFAKGGKDE